jgi:acyl-CoA synthetase (AMP-forming)/AMP-acid ligase II
VIAPLHPALPRSQMGARLQGLGARAILVGPQGVNTALVAPTGTPKYEVQVIIPAAEAATVTLETAGRAMRYIRGAPAELTDQDGLVLFTSGTTDRAKMVPLTHANVAASVRGICATYELGPEDATVAVMPFFYGHGLIAVLLASLASGGCVLLPERGRFSAHTFWDDVHATAATWFSAVPTIHEILLARSAGEDPRPRAMSLRFVRSCSAPLNIATARAFRAHLTGRIRTSSTVAARRFPPSTSRRSLLGVQVSPKRPCSPSPMRLTGNGSVRRWLYLSPKK